MFLHSGMIEHVFQRVGDTPLDGGDQRHIEGYGWNSPRELVRGQRQREKKADLKMF